MNSFRRFLQQRITYYCCSFIIVFFALLNSCSHLSTIPDHPSSLSPSSQSIQHTLDEIFSNPRFDNAIWGVVVIDPDANKTLFQSNAGISLMPASNMKLYTTAAALDILTPDYSYETRIYLDGPVDSEGVLHGNIYIKGSGDPSISGRYRKDITLDEILEQWVSAIRNRGIVRITGSIIGDDDSFDDIEIQDTWEHEDLSFWYAAGSSGLAIADNCYAYTVSPGAVPGNPADIVIEPDTSYITIINDVVTTETGGTRFAEVYRYPDTNIVRFYGTMPVDSQPVKHFACVNNGTLYTVHLFSEYLEKSGVTVDGAPRDIDEFSDKAVRFNTDRMALVHTHTSPPMSEIIKIINKPSQNFYADMVLKTIALEKEGLGSFSGGARQVTSWLENIGLPNPSTFQMRDGSGLSRRNLVQPQQTAYLLKYMRSHHAFIDYYESLPALGSEGTVEKRLKGTAAEGKARAKTGFISHARCLSGYITTQTERTLIFSMMVNNYTVPTSEANKLQDRAVSFLASLNE